MRAPWREMGMKDGMNLVFDPSAMTDDLVAARYEASQALGLGRRRPHLGQEPGGMERRKNPGVNFVGLDMCMGDRLDMQRIGDDDARHEGRENPHHGHRVARRFDDHLIACVQSLAEPFQRRARHVDAASPT